MVHTEDVINVAQYVCIIPKVVSRPGLSLILYVRISLAGRVSHLLHERCKVSTKCSPSTFQSVQGINDNGGLASINSKFGSKHCPNFLSLWGSDVGIKDITNFDLEVVQSCH